MKNQESASIRQYPVVSESIRQYPVVSGSIGQYLAVSGVWVGVGDLKNNKDDFFIGCIDTGIAVTCIPA